jgi:hypothetical protein
VGVVVLTVVLAGCGTAFAGDPKAPWRDRKGQVVSRKVITSYYGAEHCIAARPPATTGRHGTAGHGPDA